MQDRATWPGRGGARLARAAGFALAVAAAAATPAAAQMFAPTHTPQVAAPTAPLPDASGGTLVARWMLVSDRMSLGLPNPQLTAAVAMAMHDALNAVSPRYRRWLPPAAEEPAGAGATPEVALSMAAFRVLASVFPVPVMRSEAEPLLLEAFRAAVPEGRPAALALGTAIGTAHAVRLSQPAPVQPFPSGTAPGQWRPTPPFARNGMIAEIAPILFAARDGVRGAPPPALGSPRYLADLAEVRRLGALDSPERSAAQTEAAFFWAAQSSQRGFLHLGLRLLEAEPPPGGAWDEARLLSALAAALADSATMAWEEKRFHAFWRPITAIHAGGEGVVADPSWQPLLFTPPHPDYPSGHAADCGAGAAVLEALLGAAPREVVYVAMETADQPTRRYPGFAAAAEDCAESRVFAGAHFRFANEEGLRIGRAVAARAVARVAPLPASAPPAAMR